MRRREAEYYAKLNCEHEAVASQSPKGTIKEAVAPFLACEDNKNPVEPALDTFGSAWYFFQYGMRIRNGSLCPAPVRSRRCDQSQKNKRINDSGILMLVESMVSIGLGATQAEIGVAARSGNSVLQAVLADGLFVPVVLGGKSSKPPNCLRLRVAATPQTPAPVVAQTNMILRSET